MRSLPTSPGTRGNVPELIVFIGDPKEKGEEREPSRKDVCIFVISLRRRDASRRGRRVKGLYPSITDSGGSVTVVEVSGRDGEGRLGVVLFHLRVRHDPIPDRLVHGDYTSPFCPGRGGRGGSDLRPIFTSQSPVWGRESHPGSLDTRLFTRSITNTS